MAFGLLCLAYILGILLIIIELFVPGGILGFIGSAIVITTIAFTFIHHPPIYGVSLIFLTLIIVPCLLIWWLRKISLNSSQNLEDGYSSTDETLEDLIGQEGKSLTILRPTGTAKFGTRRVDVTTENTVVPADTPIKVIKVAGYKVIVKVIAPVKGEN